MPSTGTTSVAGPPTTIVSPGSDCGHELLPAVATRFTRPDVTPRAEDMIDPPVGPIAAAYRLVPVGFATEVVDDEGAAVVRLLGELDIATAPVLETALSTCLDRGPSRMALDLSELTFVDSTGVGVFVAASRRAARIGCSFTVRSPRPAVLRTLRLIGIDGRVSIEIGDTVP